MRAFTYTAACAEGERIGVYGLPLQKNNVKAIISLAGPINGYTPLTGGKDALGRNVKNLANDIVSGMTATLGLPVYGGDVLNMIDNDMLDKIFTGLGIP
jgi:hypothetical protein